MCRDIDDVTENGIARNFPYAVHSIMRYMETYSVVHLHAVYAVFCYLTTTGELESLEIRNIWISPVVTNSKAP